MAGSRYVEVPAETLLDALRAIGAKVEKSGGQVVETSQGREIVFELHPKERSTFVRVFTSLARGDSSVRGCGEDAVRLVVGTEFEGKFRPLGKSRRIYRTAPQGPEDQRVAAFIERFTQALREAFGQAFYDHPSCPRCGSPMARRKAKATGNEFFGCLRFPDCKGTRNIGESRPSPRPRTRPRVTAPAPAPAPAKPPAGTGAPERELERLLKIRDWYTEFSDDPDVRRRGARQRDRIDLLLDCIEPEVARDIWRRYAPEDIGMPEKIREETVY